jgi:hypothetical protein
MKKIIFLFLSIIFSVILTACSTGRIDSLVRKPNEAIIIANVNIINNHYNETSNSVLMFDETSMGTFHVKPDGKSFIYMKLPIGKYNLSRIEIGNRSINLPKYYTNFEIRESKLYYIGDILTELELNVNVGSAFGLIGALAYEGRTVTLPPVKVYDNYINAVSYFKSIFPCNDTIIPCIMQVDTIRYRVGQKY